MKDLKQLLGLTDEDCEQLSRKLAATCGLIDEPGLLVNFYGACPVVGYGIADDHPVFYRARNGYGSLDVYPPGTPLEPKLPDEDKAIWSTEFDADGWDEAATTEANIRAAVAQFREWRQTVADGGAR